MTGRRLALSGLLVVAVIAVNDALMVLWLRSRAPIPEASSREAVPASPGDPARPPAREPLPAVSAEPPAASAPADSDRSDSAWLAEHAASLPDRIEWLEKRAEALERRVAAFQALGGVRSQGSEDVSSLLAQLVALEDGKRAVGIVQRIAERGGDSAIPLIRQALGKQDIASFGNSWGRSGDQYSGYPDERTALLDALRQIGSDEAQQALADELARLSDEDFSEHAYFLGGEYPTGPVFDLLRDRALAQFQSAERTRGFGDRDLYAFARKRLNDDPEAFVALSNGLGGTTELRGEEEERFRALVSADASRGLAFLRQIARDPAAHPHTAAAAAEVVTDQCPTDLERIDFLRSVVEDRRLPVENRVQVAESTWHRIDDESPPGWVEALEALLGEVVEAEDKASIEDILKRLRE